MCPYEHCPGTRNEDNMSEKKETKYDIRNKKYLG